MRRSNSLLAPGVVGEALAPPARSRPSFLRVSPLASLDERSGFSPAARKVLRETTARRAARSGRPPPALAASALGRQPRSAEASSAGAVTGARHEKLRQTYARAVPSREPLD